MMHSGLCGFTTCILLCSHPLPRQDYDAFINDSPMMVLMEFMRLQNLRLVDLFTCLDKDGSKSLTREEFRDGLLVTLW